MKRMYSFYLRQTVQSVLIMTGKHSKITKKYHRNKQLSDNMMKNREFGPFHAKKKQHRKYSEVRILNSVSRLQIRIKCVSSEFQTSKSQWTRNHPNCISSASSIMSVYIFMARNSFHETSIDFIPFKFIWNNH